MPIPPTTDAPAWDDRDLRSNPHRVADKARRVRQMFSAIAGSYDLNNRLHSLGRDRVWRHRAVGLCRVRPHETVLDVACGTGDLSMAFARVGPRRVIGVDFTHEMLVVADRKKPSDSPASIGYADGDALRLPVPDAGVDVVSIAFGIRNVADPAAAIGEFHRVLRPGGRLCILEFSRIDNPFLRGLYDFYFGHVMPRTATWISGDRSGAYKYLPQSVHTFLSRQQMVEMMRDAGFFGVECHPLTFGIAVIYLGHRASGVSEPGG